MAKMLVVFASGEVGRIHETMPNHLIHKNEVIAFRRSAGWVHIGNDPIRSAKPPIVRFGNRQDDIRFTLPVP